VVYLWYNGFRLLVLSGEPLVEGQGCVGYGADSRNMAEVAPQRACWFASLRARRARIAVNRLLTLNRWVAFAIYVLLDVLCVGMGMGVPIFCIALGFPVGWYIAARAVRSSPDLRQVLPNVLVQALVTSGVTLAMMAFLWGPVTTMLFDPSADLANFGIPMILYEPLPSFIAWLVLMIFVSPFLQLLTTLFASYLTLTVSVRRRPA